MEMLPKSKPGSKCTGPAALFAFLFKKGAGKGKHRENLTTG